MAFYSVDVSVDVININRDECRRLITSKQKDKEGHVSGQDCNKCDKIHTSNKCAAYAWTCRTYNKSNHFARISRPNKGRKAMERNKNIHLVKHTNSSLTHKLIKDGTEELDEEVLGALDISQKIINIYFS